MYDKPLAKLKIKEKIQVKIRNKRRDITVNASEMKRTIKYKNNIKTNKTVENKYKACTLYIVFF